MLDIPKPESYQSGKEPYQSGNNKHDILSRLLQTSQKIEEAKKKNITFSKPILTQNGNPVFFPKTINVIQGKAGVHKSRLAETICSALLSRPENKSDLLGFKSELFNTFAIVYVDTERNLSDQLPFALQQIQLKAGYSIKDDISFFYCISLLEFDREERFEALDIYLEHVREQFKTHIFIVLDVITDCVFNFNDTKDSMKLIDMMNKSINRFDVTFLCLIHENPGNTDKARGHLGTEILNKSSTVIQISFEKDKNQSPMDLIRINYLKCRNSKKHSPLYVCYSEEERGLVIADGEIIREAADKKKFKAGISDIVELLPNLLVAKATRDELLNHLENELDCSRRTLESRLKDIITEKVEIIDNNGFKCYLDKDVENKKIIYLLHPVDTDLPF